MKTLAAALCLLWASTAWADLEPVFRPTEIVYGPTIILPCPSTVLPWKCPLVLEPYDAYNIVSTAATSAWLARENAGTFVNSTTRVVWADPNTNGERGGGVFSRMNQVGNIITAYTCTASDARGTDRMYIRKFTGNVATKAVTWQNLLPVNYLAPNLIDVYAGSDTPNADCECRPDKKCHSYCTQVEISMDTNLQEDGSTVLTCTVSLLGVGLHGGGRHYDPWDPIKTPIRTLTVVVPDAPEEGYSGFIGYNTQGLMRSSFANFSVE